MTTTIDGAVAEPEPITPPADEAKLIDLLAKMFVEDSSWEHAGTECLGYAVASRDPRFRHHRGPRTHGRWSQITLHQRIKNVRPEAKQLASYRRQNSS